MIILKPDTDTIRCTSCTELSISISLLVSTCTLIMIIMNDIIILLCHASINSLCDNNLPVVTIVRNSFVIPIARSNNMMSRFFSLCILLSSTIASVASDDQHDALMDLHRGMAPDGWKHKDNWGSAADICTWCLVDCMIQLACMHHLLTNE